MDALHDKAAFARAAATGSAGHPTNDHSRAGLSVGAVIGGIGAMLLVDQILLWRFLGLIDDGSMVALSAVAIAGAAWVVRRHGDPSLDRIGWRTLIGAAALATGLLLLGGEGRLFYAPTDWQVRGAVLRDLTLYPWPFAYAVHAEPDLLRAPLGMYLIPAMAGKILGGSRAAEFALLAQNALVLTGLFAIGATWFAGARLRWAAVLMFVGFSGMDAVGQLLAGQPLAMNPERWNLAVYSANISQIFWVPLHGFAGWIGAALYLSRRMRGMRLAWFLGPLPLLALWSPLALMGILPFAAHAGIVALRQRRIGIADIAVPAAATVMALPTLLYLASGSGAVGGGAAVLPLNHYLSLELLEVAPYLLGLWFIGRDTRFGGMPTLALITVMLLAMPYGQIGSSNDFVMRASPPALAILALMTIDRLMQPRRPGEALWRGVMLGALAIGLNTPAFELWHAVSLPRAPQILCSYFGVVPGGYDTYVTPISHVSPLIAPRHPAKITPHDPSRCWSGPWPGPMIYLDTRER